MIDVLIQGPVYSYTREFINRYRDYDFVNRVIFSTWKENEVLYRDWDIDELVLSDYPSNPGLGNRNLQLVTSLAGMNKIHSSVVMKIRSDMFVPLDKIWYFYCTERINNNILTLSIYPRFPFHPRDHMFIGNSKDMWELFDIPLDKVKDFQYNESTTIRTETYIGSHYCRKFNPEIQKFVDEPYKYLTDSASHKDEALKISNQLISDGVAFQPLPQLPIEWPKHYPNGYPFRHLKNLYGETYHEDLSNEVRM